jgi:tetratricopeptide (TPR) repeat protein
MTDTRHFKGNFNIWRRFNGWMLLLAVSVLCPTVSSVADSPERVFFLPLVNRTHAGQAEWVSWGLKLKIEEYLEFSNTCQFISLEPVRQQARLKRVELDERLEQWEVRKILAAAGADFLLTGEYEVFGKTARVTVRLYEAGQTGEVEIKRSGKLYHFGSLAQRLTEGILHRLRRETPPALRKYWQKDDDLGEEYGLYVEAVKSESLLRGKDVGLLRKYLDKRPRDLPGALLLADRLYQDKPSEAIELLENTLQWAPQCGRLYAGLGYLQAEKNLTEEARQSYRQADQCEDRYPELYFNWGNLLRRQSLSRQAERIYLKGIKAFPETAYLYYNLAVLYLEMGQASEAGDYYRQAWKRDKSLRRDFFENRYTLDDRWILSEESDENT